MAFSGAEEALQCCQTPNVSNALTEPERRAEVRLSGFCWLLAITAVAMPAVASAMAAVIPAGPAPTTTTSNEGNDVAIRLHCRSNHNWVADWHRFLHGPGTQRQSSTTFPVCGTPGSVDNEPTPPVSAVATCEA